MYDIMILYPGTFSYTALCFSLLLCQHSFCQQCLLLVTEKIIQYIRELMSAHELPTVYILIKKTYYNNNTVCTVYRMQYAVYETCTVRVVIQPYVRHTV